MKKYRLISTRPYLLRAYYEWIVANQLTPYVLVDATQEGAEVPLEFARDGQIVFNLAPKALAELVFEQKYLRFRASFSGEARTVYVPIEAVLGVYAMETGEGMMFDPEEAFYWPNEGEGTEGCHLKIIE